MSTTAYRRSTNLLSTVGMGALVLGALPVLAGQVTLTREGTSASLSGNLIAYDGDLYVVDTGFGMIGVSGADIDCTGPGCPTALPINIAAAPSSDGQQGPNDVLVTDGTGKLSVAGRLLSFEEGIYTIETVIGRININVEGTQCDGPGCPDANGVLPPLIEQGAVVPQTDPVTEVAAVTPPPAPEPAPAPEPEPSGPALIPLASLDGEADVRIAGEASLLRRLLPALAEDYAQVQGLAVRIDTGTLVPVETAADTDTPAGTIAAVMGDAGSDTALRVAGTMTGSAAEADDARIIGAVDIAFLRTDPYPGSDELAGSIVMGVDALVGLVSPENPVSDLSVDNLGAVLSGDVTNWSELGGDDLEIRVVSYPQAHDLYAQIAATDAAQTIVADAPAAAQVVASDPSAFALADLDSAGDAKILGLLDACGRVTHPDTATLKLGGYPLDRLVVARAAGSDPLSAHLTLSAASTARAAGLADLSVEGLSMAADRDTLDASIQDLSDPNTRFRAAAARDLMTQTLRLSTLLRMDDSGALDARSAAGLDNVVSYLGEAGVGDVLLAGFSTSASDPATNQTTSVAAARAAQDALNAADTDNVLASVLVRSTGFGEVLPGSCAQGGETWVEIWIRA